MVVWWREVVVVVEVVGDGIRAPMWMLLVLVQLKTYPQCNRSIQISHRIHDVLCRWLCVLVVKGVVDATRIWSYCLYSWVYSCVYVLATAAEYAGCLANCDDDDENTAHQMLLLHFPPSLHTILASCIELQSSCK